MSLLSKAGILWRQRSSLGFIIRRIKPSFSQYGEDEVFEKLLRPSKRGTYVDVGANHPIDGSNTFQLYLRGWSGVAIEPNPRFQQEFQRHRPRDRYLLGGVATKPATLIYNAFENDVFNTFDSNAVDRLLNSGERLVSRTQVNCRTLAEIVDGHLAGKQIDLLNVDCEGMDIDVLESLDLNKRRPTVIIVEDYPRYLTFQRGEPTRHLERFLRERGYMPIAQMAWSGLYVAEDWRELFLLSPAFDEERVQNVYLPGQAVLSETDQ